MKVIETDEKMEHRSFASSAEDTQMEVDDVDKE